MICTCRVIIIVVIVGARLLGLHAEKFTSVHNYSDWRAFHVMNTEGD